MQITNVRRRSVNATEIGNYVLFTRIPIYPTSFETIQPRRVRSKTYWLIEYLPVLLTLYLRSSSFGFPTIICAIASPTRIMSKKIEKGKDGAKQHECRNLRIYTYLEYYLATILEAWLLVKI